MPALIKKRRLSFQSLEDRSLMATDVTVSVVGGSLFISNADNASTNLVVTQTGSDTFRITGGASTKVNNSASYVAHGVTGGVNVNLGGGNDNLVFAAGVINGDLTIYTGAGKDTVTLSALAVNGNGLIDTSANQNPELRAKTLSQAASVTSTSNDADTVTIAGCYFAGSESTSTSASRSSSSLKTSVPGLQGIIVNRFSGPLNPNGGNLSIYTGDGADKLTMSAVAATRSIFASMGNDKDMALATAVGTKTLTFDMGEGNDNLTLIAVAAQDAILNGGPGSNKLTQVATKFTTLTKTGF